MKDEQRTKADLNQWTLDNVFTIARRELRRAEDGKPLRLEMWSHVLRLCEKAGCQERTVGVLRGVETRTDDIHVHPKNDLREHVMARDCWCQPRCQQEGNGVIVVHQSADGRELIEESLPHA